MKPAVLYVSEWVPKLVLPLPHQLCPFKPNITDKRSQIQSTTDKNKKRPLTTIPNIERTKKQDKRLVEPDNRQKVARYGGTKDKATIKTDQSKRTTTTTLYNGQRAKANT